MSVSPKWPHCKICYKILSHKQNPFQHISIACLQLFSHRKYCIIPFVKSNTCEFHSLNKYYRFNCHTGHDSMRVVRWVTGSCQFNSCQPMFTLKSDFFIQRTCFSLSVRFYRPEFLVIYFLIREKNVKIIEISHLKDT